MADAESTLRTLLDEIAEKLQYENHNVEISSFNTAGANYTSVLFFITLKAPGKDDLKLFAKVATVGEKIRAQGYVDKLYVAEQQFYNDIISVWTGLQDKYDIPEEHKFPFPKFYAGNPTVGYETVVLENLAAYGYTTYNRFKPVDWEYASKSMEVLANFHALSFIHQRDFPEEYAEIARKLVFELPPEDESMKDAWAKMLQGPLGVLNEEYRGRVLKFLDGDKTEELYLKYNTPRRHHILVHGDYRPSNMMHKLQDGEYKIVTVDYQTIHTGCPVTDLIYFVCLCTDEAFRAKHWDQLLEHYYDQLSLALRRFQMDPTEVYPREEFDEDLKEMLPFAVLVGLMVLPVITVEAENAPKMSGDADIDSFIVTPNELFVSRFTGLINDCVRWGVI